MPKRILLISANNHTSPYPVYPLGVSYLRTYLNRAMPELEVDLYDMNFGDLEGLEQKLSRNKYDYVGLSMRNIDDNNLFARNSFVEWYRKIASCVHTHSQAVLVAGGAGFSIYPDILLTELAADYGIQGEGEQSLAALISGEDPTGIQGLVYRTNQGAVCVNPRKTYEHSLALEFEHDWIEHYWDRSGMLNIQTKRGCPNQCIYCSYPVIEGRNIRTLDSHEVVDTLKELYFNKQVSYVFFTDSVFNLDRSYNEELAARIIESGMKINWGAYFSPRNLNRSDLALYKKAGLTHIEFGTDSFSDRQLEHYRKGFTWSDVREKSRFCDELGIFYAHFMILAGYGETEDTLEETFSHSQELPNAVIFPYVGMRIYPDTWLFEKALQEGRIHSREDLLNPVYYVADGIEICTIEPRAKATGARWVFPDEGNDALIARFRSKKRRGPLWEYLKYELS